MSSVLLENRLEQARQLISRLERVSADSVWAHRSSGFRGSLLKWIDRAERQLTAPPAPGDPQLELFDMLHTTGLELLAQAAREGLSKRGYRR